MSRLVLDMRSNGRNTQTNKKKLEKEANRYIRQWPEEKIAIENGRWGPFIRFNKKMLKLSANGANGKFTPEELSTIELDEVKKMIVAQDPKAFDKMGFTYCIHRPKRESQHFAVSSKYVQVAQHPSLWASTKLVQLNTSF